MKKKANLLIIIFLCVFALLGCFKSITNNSTSNNDTTNDIPTNENINIDFSNMVVNCLGDSLTEGLIANGSQMANPYPKQLKNLLGVKKVNNYGMGGSMLSLTGGYSMCERFDDMEEADIIMVMGGTNDALSLGWSQGWKATLGTIDDTDESTVYGSLDVICKGLKQRYPNSFIFFTTPFELADYYNQICLTNSGFTLDDVCLAIKIVCARYDISVFDAFKLCSFKEQANYDYASGIGDGIHPRQQFIDNFSIQLTNYIKENYKK